MVRPVDDWRRTLRKAWSVRLIVLAALLSGVEAMLSLIGGIPGVPTGLFAILSGAVSCGAFAARLVAQRSMQDGD